MKIRNVLLAALVLCLATFASALPKRPANSYVYDENRLMSAQQVEFFDKLASELYRKTGVAIAAALVDDIGRQDARMFALETAETGHLVFGTLHTNEGILIFVAMKQRRRSVEVGYGAEGYLPDALVERLQQKTLIPAFRTERYGEGIVALAYGIAEVVAREKGVTLEISGKDLRHEDPVTLREWIFIILIFAIVIGLAVRGNKMNYRPSASSGRKRRASGFGGGSFGGYSGRGGGFSGGFGGGHFGGGGSGGSW